MIPIIYTWYRNRVWPIIKTIQRVADIAVLAAIDVGCNFLPT